MLRIIRPAHAARLARTVTTGLQRAARTSSRVLLYGSVALCAGVFTSLIHVNASLLTPPPCGPWPRGASW